MIFTCDSRVNQGTSFSVHIVFTKDLQMAKQLTTMTADDYFRACKSGYFAQNFPSTFYISNVSVSPGQAMKQISAKLKTIPVHVSDYKAAYCFVNTFFPKGTNRVKLPSSENITIQLSLQGPRIVGEGGDIPHQDGALENNLSGLE